MMLRHFRLLMRASAFAMALALAATLMATPAADAAEVATVSVQEPRAFGHAVGDLVVRQVTVHLPAGSEFDETSLPQSARRGQAIELRQITHQSEWAWLGPLVGRWVDRRHELTLVYQVFLSPPEVRTLELPPLALRVKSPTRSEELRVDAWPLTVAPLAPAEASVREGLGLLRPDAPPPLIDLSMSHARLWCYAALLVLLGAYLLHVYIGLPWWARQRRPFTQAWRATRRLPEVALAGQQQMFRRLHEALNQTAGRVVFETDLDTFLAEHPRFSGIRTELAVFFQRSREQFFGGAAADVETAVWLRRFCKACCDAERGVA